MSRGAGRPATVRLGPIEVEVRRSWLAFLAAYLLGGVVTALAGNHLSLGGGDGIVANAVAFTVLALGAALFHELGHALAGLAFGRRPLALVLRAGAAVRIEEARPGSRGDSALAESLVALSGPLASGLIALAYLNTGTSYATPFAWAGLLALLDGLINLVPVPRSDGARILQAIRHAGTTSAPADPAGA